jgi:hypothetical protein
VSWALENAGMTDTRGDTLSVYALIVSGSNLFAGTDVHDGTTSSVWRRPLSEMITAVQRKADPIPVKYALDQNYPNPFNPSTMISYQVNSLSKVSLKVYDLLGREVATLVDELKGQGSYSVIFNATNIPSGVYFYRFQSGKYSETKKLLLLK